MHLMKSTPHSDTMQSVIKQKLAKTFAIQRPTSYSARKLGRESQDTGLGCRLILDIQTDRRIQIMDSWSRSKSWEVISFHDENLLNTPHTYSNNKIMHIKTNLLNSSWSAYWTWQKQSFAISKEKGRVTIQSWKTMILVKKLKFPHAGWN